MYKEWRRVFCFVFVVGLMISSLTGCGAKGGEATSDGKKIAIICNSAGQNDNGYNQSAIVGAEKVKQEMGYDYKVVEPTNGVPAALEALAGDGYDIIFNLEYDFDALIKGVGGAKPIAEVYPDTTFVCFNDNPNINEDGSVIHKNVISVLFDVHESSYLAGALSVQVIEQAKILFSEDKYQFTDLEQGGRAIGFIGGTNSNGITVFSNGFMEGVNKAAQDAGVTYHFYAKYDAGFADPALGSSVAGTYYKQGTNVVFTVAGNVGDGVTTKAKEEQKLSIQVDADKDNQQPGYVLTSVLKLTEVPVYEICTALKEGRLAQMNNLQSFSLASKATGITQLAEIEKNLLDTDEAKIKWEEIKAYIADLEGQIANGEIKVTNAAIGENIDLDACKNLVIK